MAIDSTGDTISVKLYGSKKVIKLVVSKKGKTETVADISNAMQTSGSVPEGYNGAEGKVWRYEGTLVTMGTIEKNGPGIIVEFKTLKAKGAEILSMKIKGDISRDQSTFIGEPGSSDHILAVYTDDENGRIFSFEKTDISDEELVKAIKSGTTLELPLKFGKSEKLDSIKQIQICFPARTGVSSFEISDIKLLKRIR